MNQEEIRNQLEGTLRKLEKVSQIQHAVDENYFTDKIDYKDTSPDMQMSIIALCMRFPTYTALLNIAHDYVREVIEELDKIIDQTATQ